MKIEHIIKGSVLSEKAYSLNEKGAYVLKVAKTATKTQIINALKDTFNVDTVKINTLITRGKIRRKARSKRSAPMYVKLSNIKKAIVKLKEGQTLPVSLLQNSEAPTT